MPTDLIIPGITDTNTLVCLSRARKFKGYCKAVVDALAGKCPFCQIDKDYNTVIHEDELFATWPCKPAEDNTAFHFLIVPKRHITANRELTDTEKLRLFTFMDWLDDKFNITSQGILCRDGDATLSAGTIQHLHWHVMVPNGTGRVESPFYKGHEADVESLARAIVFEKIRQAIERGLPVGEAFEGLTQTERDLVTGRLN
ncbi:MAG: HIT domain-containing protein [Parcubacteria group bacterium]|nr:HIT domain-containing protein [Parcubacteria group bacterium]